MKEMPDERRSQVVDWLKMMSAGKSPVGDFDLPDCSILKNEDIVSVLSDAAILIDELSRADVRRRMIASRLRSLSFPQDAEPLTVSEFCDWLNTKANVSRGCSVQPRDITAFLEAEGYLVTQSNDEGYVFKVATVKGGKLGIDSRPRAGKNGAPYFVNYYNPEACNYILKNLIMTE